MKKKYFSHLDKNNYAKIVNINTKKITKRTAIAEGRIKFSKLAFNKILKQELKKEILLLEEKFKFLKSE